MSIFKKIGFLFCSWKQKDVVSIFRGLTTRVTALWWGMHILHAYRFLNLSAPVSMISGDVVIATSKLAFWEWSKYPNTGKMISNLNLHLDWELARLILIPGLKLTTFISGRSKQNIYNAATYNCCWNTNRHFISETATLPFHSHFKSLGNLFFIYLCCLQKINCK